MKKDLKQIWNKPDKNIATDLLNGWIKTAMNSAIAPLVKIGKTLLVHQYGIINWYEHPIASGALEDMDWYTVNLDTNFAV